VGLGANGQHVDDPAPLARFHLRPHQPGHAHGREQFLVEIGLQDFIGEIFERACARGTGIVNQNVDLAERLHRLVIGALDVARDADIALDWRDFPFAVFAIAAFAASSASRPRPMMATSAPDCANRVATARPMPLLPPVTMAERPERSMFI